MEIMTLSEIMDKSIAILRKHVKSIALFSVGYGIIVFILAFAVIVLGTIITLFSVGLFTNMWLTGVLIGLMIVIASAIGFSFYAGTIKIASQEYMGEEIFAQDAIKASFKSIFKVLGIIVCGLVIFLPVGGVLWFVGKLFYNNYEDVIINFDRYTGKALLLIVPPLLFIIMIIFIIIAYSIWFSYSINVLVVEKKGVFASVKRSFKLVRKSYWKVFGCVMLFSLTAFALRSSLDTILAVISGIIYLITKLLGINGDFITFFSSIYSYASWPINLVTWMVISPISIIMLSLLYFNERFKREGLDIALRLKEIQKNEERKQLSEVTEFDDSL